MPKKSNQTELMMSFYDDIDVDFGDKGELGVGDVIALLEENSLDSKLKSKNKRSIEIVFEDEIGSDEYEDYNPSNTDYLSYSADPDFVDGIAREVSEVTGNAMLNEQLENHYHQKFLLSKPKKTSKKKNTIIPEVDQKITKKSDLRKEMAFRAKVDNFDDFKVTFSKEKRINALVNSVASAEKSKIITKSPKFLKNDAESLPAAEEEQTDLLMDSAGSFKMDRVRQWVNNSDTIEDEFHSSNDTNFCTVSASASDSKTLKRIYRATSKRFVKKPSPTTKISDAKVNFKITPKVTSTARPNSTMSKPLVTKNKP